MKRNDLDLDYVQLSGSVFYLRYCLPVRGQQANSYVLGFGGIINDQRFVGDAMSSEIKLYNMDCMEAMKLSEILGWIKKSPLIKGQGANNRNKDVQFCRGYNTALTSCDREIDREALAKVIADYFESEHRKHIKAVQEGDWGANGAWSTEVSDVITDLSQAIISTMPTWLKKVNGK